MMWDLIFPTYVVLDDLLRLLLIWARKPILEDFIHAIMLMFDLVLKKNFAVCSYY